MTYVNQAGLKPRFFGIVSLVLFGVTSRPPSQKTVMYDFNQVVRKRPRAYLEVVD
jgi:hypothetical protein